MFVGEVDQVALHAVGDQQVLDAGLLALAESTLHQLDVLAASLLDQVQQSALRLNWVAARQHLLHYFQQLGHHVSGVF